MTPCPYCGSSYNHAPNCPAWQQARTRPRTGPHPVVWVTLALVIVAVLSVGGLLGVRALTRSEAASPRWPSTTGVPGTSAAAVTGIWRGDYLCDSTWRGLRLTVLPSGLSGDSDVRATFTFYEDRSAITGMIGSFSMQGSYTGAGLDLRPSSWISRPSGYEMVGLRATPPSGNVMTGSITSGASGCASFRVTRG